MKITALDYTYKQKALDIYVSGCRGPHCKNCHNPLLWDFNTGQYWIEWKWKIEDYIREYPEIIENFMIFGGEPLDQPIKDLIDMLKWLKWFQRSIWLFTGKEKLDLIDKDVLMLIDYIKIGSYREEMGEGREYFGIQLATSNQKIYRVKRGIVYD